MIVALAVILVIVVVVVVLVVVVVMVVKVVVVVVVVVDCFGIYTGILDMRTCVCSAAAPMYSGHIGPISPDNPNPKPCTMNEGDGLAFRAHRDLTSKKSAFGVCILCYIRNERGDHITQASS